MIFRFHPIYSAVSDTTFWFMLLSESAYTSRRLTALFVRWALGAAFLLRKSRHPITGKRGVPDAEPIKNFQRSWNIGPSSTLTEIRVGPHASFRRPRR